METYSDHYNHNVNRAALEDEEVSLCDLPLTTRKTTITAENNSTNTKHGKFHPSATTPSSSSDPAAEFFEFLTNLNSTSGIQCSAEEVIFSGQLLPFAPPPRPPRSPHSKPSDSTSAASSSSASIRRRSEPVHKEAKATVPRCSSTKSIRPFRSHDYMRLNRNNSLSGSQLAEKSRSFDRNLSIGKENRSSGLGNPPLFSSSDVNSDQKESNKLPWWLMLGLVKYPTDQVEMKDMKNRQSRRNYPATFIPEPAPAEKPSLSGDDIDHRRRSRTEKQKSSNIINVPASIRKKSSSSWRLLNVLSCKSHASVAVTTSFPTIPT